MATYNQISKKYGIEKKQLYRAVYGLKIKNTKKDFTAKEIFEIINYKPPGQSNKKYDRRKITIIEFYEKWGSGRKVAIFLNIERRFVLAAIKEYKETGCLIIESKLNKNEN